VFSKKCLLNNPGEVGGSRGGRFLGESK